jgi:hypothetical protein
MNKHGKHFKKITNLIKISAVFIILLLNGCALLGTAIKLAPLAAIFVYYSAPTQVEDNEFACIKTTDYYKQNSRASEAAKIRSKHSLCMVNINNNEVEEILDITEVIQGHNPDKAKMYFDDNEIYLVLENENVAWKIDKNEKCLSKIINVKLLPAGYNNSSYAMLPSPEIRNIKLP